MFETHCDKGVREAVCKINVENCMNNDCYLICICYSLGSVLVDNGKSTRTLNTFIQSKYLDSICKLI